MKDPSSTENPRREQARAASERRTKRVLNVPLLVGTLAVAAVLAPVAYAWHRYQVGRTAEAFLERADRLESQGDWTAAATYLHRYLRLDPDNADVRIRLAETFDKSAEDPWQKTRAVDLYYLAVGVAPDLETELALRRRLGELQLELGPYELGRFALAEKEAEELLDQNDADGRRLLALALYGQFQGGALTSRDDVPQVIETFDRALEANPADVELAGTFARICREEDALCLEEGQALLNAFARLCGGPERVPAEEKQDLGKPEREQLADKVMEDMVSAGPQNQEALLARYRYRVTYELPGAEEDLGLALKYGEDDLTVRQVAAEHARREARRAQQDEASSEEAQKHFAEARQHYQRAIELAYQRAEERAKARRDHQGPVQFAPADGVSFLGLGELHLANGDINGAIRTWQRALDECDWESGPLGPLALQVLASLRTRMPEVVIVEGRLERLGKEEDQVAAIYLDLDEDGRRDPGEPTAGALLDALDRTIRELAPRLPQLARLSLERMRDLLRGRYYVRKGEYPQAIPLFKRVAAGRAASELEIGQNVEASTLLGGLYASLGQWDQAAIAYEAAATLQPKGTQARLSAAAAWTNAGRPEMAARHYEQALDIEANPEMCLGLAGARFQREVRLPKAQRSWARFDEALTQAKQSWQKEPREDGWRVKLLEADYTVVRAEEQGQPERGKEQAQVMLLGTEQEYPESAELFERLPFAYERFGFPADAGRALRRFTDLAGDSAASYLVRSRFYSYQKQYEKARDVLRAGLENDELPDSADFALQAGLAQVAVDEGQFEEARKELRRLHELGPSNIATIRLLAELALEANDLADAETWEKKLRELEGPEGLLWRYYRAGRLLGLASGPEDPQFIEAAQLQAQVRSLRPAWPNAHRLGGVILEGQGRYEDAIEAYQDAVRLGEQPIRIYERLLPLLYALGRDKEADEYLSQLGQQAPASPRLSEVGVSLAASQGRLERAIERARRAVESRPDDPVARILLGQVLQADKQTDEAEKVLREAVELAPSDVQTYNALLTFYRRTGQVDQMAATLDQYAKNAKLSDVARLLLSAQKHLLRGEQEEAEACLREAVRLGDASEDLSGQLNAQRLLAQFLLRKDVGQAAEVLRGILELAPGDDAARRSLAAIQAASGLSATGEDRDQTWKNVESQLKDDPRLMAQLLLRRGGEESLQKAEQLLKKLIGGRGDTVGDDRFLLARVYDARATLYQRQAKLFEDLENGIKQQESAGNLEELSAAHEQYEEFLQKSQAEYTALVATARPSLIHLASFIDFLLRHDSLDDAATWLTKLEDLAPDSLGTVTLRARYFQKKELPEEIEKLVEGEEGKEGVADRLLDQIEKGGEAEAILALRIGGVYSAVEQHAAAERWYRRVFELVPENYENLALSLADQGRVKDAIQLCLEAAKTDDSPKPAIVLAYVLASSKPTAEESQLAEPLLATALKNHGDNPDVLRSIANVRLVQGRTEETVKLYRQVVKLTPRDVLTLNNLATLLLDSDQPESRQEALQYVERAIRSRGPHNDLLDTKATILLCLDRVDEAVQLLETVTAAPNADPRYHFHLAVAYYRKGETDSARGALDEAMDRDLMAQILTQTDRGWLAELEKELR